MTWPSARSNPPSPSPSPRRRAATPCGWRARSRRCWRNCAAPCIPDEVEVRITRNYGETANEKVNDLVVNLAMGILTVVGLIALTMSWREGLIVGLAIPITYSLTLLFNYLLGYTINRVTLFALILALGLLVDDPIVGVENIYRHSSRMKKLPAPAGRRPGDGRSDAADRAGDAGDHRVASSRCSSSRGMMGPYMAPDGAERAAHDDLLPARRAGDHAVGVQQAAQGRRRRRRPSLRREDHRHLPRLPPHDRAVRRLARPQRASCCSSWAASSPSPSSWR